MSAQPIHPTTNSTQTFIQRHKFKLSGIAVLATMGVAWAFKAAMDGRYPFSQDPVLWGTYDRQSRGFHISVNSAAFKDTDTMLDALAALVKTHADRKVLP